LHSTGLYEYTPRTMDVMREWFGNKIKHQYPVIGIENDSGDLLGFASYGAFRPWPAYKYSVEHSVYVHREHRAQGVGAMLVTELIAIATQQEYHVIIGGIDAENKPSIALHEKLGFVHAGTIRQSGFKFGRWLDLAFYQRVLMTPLMPVDG